MLTSVPPHRTVTQHRPTTHTLMASANLVYAHAQVVLPQPTPGTLEIDPSYAWVQVGVWKSDGCRVVVGMVHCSAGGPPEIDPSYA